VFSATKRCTASAHPCIGKFDANYRGRSDT
jgi:hypothetical protein